MRLGRRPAPLEAEKPGAGVPRRPCRPRSARGDGTKHLGGLRPSGKHPVSRSRGGALGGGGGAGATSPSRTRRPRRARWRCQGHASRRGGAKTASQPANPSARSPHKRSLGAQARDPGPLSGRGGCPYLHLEDERGEAQGRAVASPRPRSKAELEHVPFSPRPLPARHLPRRPAATDDSIRAHRSFQIRPSPPRNGTHLAGVVRKSPSGR